MMSLLAGAGAPSHRRRGRRANPMRPEPLFAGRRARTAEATLETTMSEPTQRTQAGPSSEASLAEPLLQMIHGVGETVRREVQQLRAEASERATGGARGAGLLAAAGASATVALGATASLPLMALRRLMPGWMIAVAVAGGTGALSVVLARRGLSELGAAAPLDGERIRDAVRDALRSLS